METNTSKTRESCESQKNKSSNRNNYSNIVMPMSSNDIRETNLRRRRYLNDPSGDYDSVDNYRDLLIDKQTNPPLHRQSSATSVGSGKRPLPSPRLINSLSLDASSSSGDRRNGMIAELDQFDDDDCCASGTGTAGQKIPEMYPTDTDEEYEIVSSSQFKDMLSWLDQPLYQDIYKEDPERRSEFAESDFDGVELRREELHLSGATAMVFVQKRTTPWVQVNQVIDSGLLMNITKQEIDYQEAKFEILTSEASFQKSLRLLATHYIDSPQFRDNTVISIEEHRYLFSGIKKVKKCSKIFFEDLEKCWNKSIFLFGIFDVVCNHTKNNFKAFETYCCQVQHIQKKLKQLSEKKKFADSLEELTNQEACQGKDLNSFLTLPLSRITKLHLPLEKALSLLTNNRQSYGPLEYHADRDKCLLALDYIRAVAYRCDRDAKIQRCMTEMFEIDKELIFPDSMTKIALISPERWFVKRGEVKQHSWCEMKHTLDEGYKVMHLKKSSAVLTLFLLNDMLVISKKKKNKGEMKYKVTDYCERRGVSATIPLQPVVKVDPKQEFQFRLVLEKNQEQKRIEMIISCDKVKERQYWMDLLEKKSVTNETIKTDMVCVYEFQTSDPGQLSLREGDMVTITRVLDNGWYEGERRRDRKRGIFPPSRVEEVKK